MNKPKPKQPETGTLTPTHAPATELENDASPDDTYEIPDLNLSLLNNDSSPETETDQTQRAKLREEELRLVDVGYDSPSHPSPRDLTQSESKSTEEGDKDFFDNTRETQSQLIELEEGMPTPLPSNLITDTQTPLGAIPKKPTSITTLEPYAPTSGARKQRRKKYVNLDIVRYEKMFGGETWTPFLNIKTEEKMTALTLELALLEIHPSKELKFRKKSDYEWLIETTTQKQSEVYLQLKTLCNKRVNVTKHETLNYRFGTVSIPQYDGGINIDEDKEKLLKAMRHRDKKIVDLELYELKSRGRNSKIQIPKIKYSGLELPRVVMILGTNCEVREHIPKPMQCQKCWKYGHTTKKCRGTKTCANCASTTHPEDVNQWECENQKKCPNCGEQHHAKSKSCKYYIYNADLTIMQARNGYSIAQARVEMRIKGHTNPAYEKSFKDTLTTNAPAISFSNQPSSTPAKPVQEETKTENAIATQNRFSYLAEKEEEPNQTDSEETIDFDDVISTPKTNMTSPKRRKISQSPKQAQAGFWTPQEQRKTERSRTPPRDHKAKEVAHKQTLTSDKPSLGVPSQLDASVPQRPTTEPQTPEEQPKNKPHQKTDDPEPHPDGNEKQAQGTETATKTKETAKMHPLKPHPDTCGCHSCFYQKFTKNKNFETNQLMQIIKEFCEDRTPPTNHYNPPALCRCATHLKEKIAEDEWINKIVKEIRTKFEKPTLDKNSNRAHNTKEPVHQERSQL